MSIPNHEQDSVTYQTHTRTLQRAHRKLISDRCSGRTRQVDTYLHCSSHGRLRHSSRRGTGPTGDGPARGVQAQPVTPGEVSAAARGKGWRAGAGGPSAPLGLPTPGNVGYPERAPKAERAAAAMEKNPAPPRWTGLLWGLGSGPGPGPGPEPKSDWEATASPPPATLQTPQSGMSPETSGRAKQEVPPPRQRHWRRGRWPRPEAVRGRRRASRAWGSGQRRRERRGQGGAPRGLWGPRRSLEPKGTHSPGPDTCLREPEWRAQLSGKPLSLASSPRNVSAVSPSFALLLRSAGSSDTFSSLRALIVVLPPPPPAFVPDCADGMSLEVSWLPCRPWGLGPRVGSRRSLPGGNGQVRKEAQARVPPRTARSKSQKVLARVQGPLVSVVSMNYTLQIIGQWEKDYLRNY